MTIPPDDRRPLDDAARARATPPDAAGPGADRRCGGNPTGDDVAPPDAARDAGADRRRNGDADWDAWPVEEYLAENYRRLHPSDAAVIAGHSQFYRRLAPESLARTVEIGAGPNLYPLMLQAAASRHIDAVEPGAAGRRYLRRQVRHGPDPSWLPFYTACRRGNPTLPPSLPGALARVTVRAGDLRTVAGAGYDLASMHFVAESVTTDPAEFRQLCAHFTAAVHPGGWLVAAFMAGMPTYRLGDGSTWPAHPVDASTLHTTFAPTTTHLTITAIPPDPTLPDYGDTGMLLLHARRRSD